MRFAPDLIAASKTGLYIGLEALMLAVAVGYGYVWRGPPGKAISAKKLARYKSSSLYSLALAAIILVRLVTNTYG
jgi:hypothetical protein